MDFVDRGDDRPEPISIARCRELLGDEADTLTDQDVELIRRHAETMAQVVVQMYRGEPSDSWVITVPSRHTLPAPTIGFNLRPMVGAVIYVRVSTKEQTENLSLPTQLRACEEYCRRQGYEVLERFQSKARARKRRIVPSCRSC